MLKAPKTNLVDGGQMDGLKVGGWLLHVHGKGRPLRIPTAMAP